MKTTVVMVLALFVFVALLGGSSAQYYADGDYDDDDYMNHLRQDYDIHSHFGDGRVSDDDYQGEMPFARGDVRKQMFEDDPYDDEGDD